VPVSQWEELGLVTASLTANPTRRAFTEPITRIGTRAVINSRSGRLRDDGAADGRIGRILAEPGRRAIQH
jgi:hypothetical protein